MARGAVVTAAERMVASGEEPKAVEAMVALGAVLHQEDMAAGRVAAVAAVVAMVLEMAEAAREAGNAAGSASHACQTGVGHETGPRQRSL